jgi:predicted dienelactone hydrolase
VPIRRLQVAALAVGSLLAGYRSFAEAPSGASPPKPAFELPAPTGSEAVGTTVWRLTDESRRETLGDSPGPRQVEVIAYYPAQPSAAGTLAPYLREGRAEVRSLFPPEKGSAALDALAAVRTHATLDAPPKAGSGRRPLLLFSHGLGGFASGYAALLEDLASHGYVVLSIVHPYESGGAALADGSVVSFLDAAGKARPEFLAVIREWKSEDKTMASVTRAIGDEEQRRLLRAYLAGLQHTDATLRRWVDDTRLVLDRLASLPATSPGIQLAAQLAAQVDLQRIGVFGHSMGGVAAGQLCVEDPRCRAGLNLDGIPQYGTMIDVPLKRPFLMVYSERPGRAGASDPIYRRAASPYYRVDVRGTLHLDFSDLIFWGGMLRERRALGTIAPERATEITRTIVREYFDQTLRERPSGLLAGKVPFPEVKVRIVLPVAPRGAAE